MTGGKSPDTEFSDEEAARRRDDVIRRMIATPPQPKPKPEPNASPKKRGCPRKDHENVSWACFVVCLPQEVLCLL